MSVAAITARSAQLDVSVRLLICVQSVRVVSCLLVQIVGLNFPNKYEATAGVRILELEEQLAVRQHEGAEEEELNCVVELWDCSGDQSYEACWAAICQNLDGIIVAFDPTNKSQANDVRIWCEWFCKRAHLVDGQVVIFAHGELSGNHKPLSIRAGDRTVLSPIVNVSTLQVPQPDEDGMVAPGPAKIEFRNFCSKVWETKAAQQ